jgi:hypothetical protein
MALNTSGACIKVAACICAKDGVISEAEELRMYQLMEAKFPEFCDDSFERAFAEFFDSDYQIEDYLSQIDDDALRRFTLELAESSAGADGLDPRENIALEKAYLIWGVNRHA